MTRTRKTNLILATAAAQALLAAAASAQVPANQDGRAMDANNRVGSGGMNAPSGQIGVNPNQIVYGNVTGGKQFRGPVGSRDPGAFTGPSPARFMDRFVAGSSGVPQPYQPQVDLSTPQPFYGMARYAPPPVGSVRLGYTGAYLGNNLVPSEDISLNAQYASSGTDYLTQRLGVSQVLGTRSTLVGTTEGAESYLPAVGPENQNTVFSGSALYGIQPLRSNLEDQAATGQPAGMLAGPGDRFRVDNADIRRMRSELENAPEQQQPNPQNPENPNAPAQPGLGQPFNSQEANPQQNPLGFSNDLQSGQPTQRRYTIVSPELQSTQYREMRQRLAQYENPQYAQMEAQHRARMERQAIARREAGAASQPAQPNTGINPDAVAAGTLKQPGMGAINAEPVKVKSLATGVRAKGLHDMLAQAEDLMRQGKFQTALDRYDVALQIAPNNPLVSLGRANAELGAGAYRLATADLHRVFSSDHATLVAQYDLKGWFPPERLTAITTELTQLSTKDPKDEMPEFLLAYIAYNTGEPDAASQHLAEARKRASNADPLLDFMEHDWKLHVVSPKPPAQPDFNK